MVSVGFRRGILRNCNGLYGFEKARLTRSTAIALNACLEKLHAARAHQHFARDEVAHGEQKNSTAPAASSTVPARPSGLAAITLSSIACCTPTRISCPFTSIFDSAVNG